MIEKVPERGTHGTAGRKGMKTGEVNVRLLALEVLLAVTRDGQYSHIALGQVLEKYQYLSKQERSFLTRLCEGTLEHMIRIDYVLNQFSSVKVNKMKPVIRCILRAAVYELQFMDAVPPQASCNEAVKLAQKKGFASLKGFVNGVLRTVSRNLDKIVFPDPQQEPLQWLSVTYSMPEWILEEWLVCYGMEETRRILEAFLAEPATCVRADTARISQEELAEKLRREGVTVRKNPLLPQSLLLTDYDFLWRIPSFAEGLFYVQDTSSMRAVLAAWEGLFGGGEAEGAEGAVKVLDVCGAPGGKSIYLAQLLGERGQVEARDLSQGKVELIRENIARCRLSNLKARVQDARVFCPDDVESAELVLADLPCSGLGVIGRKPDIKYRMTKKQQQELAFLQREILGTVCAYVKPGGTLLYSTCTIGRLENEENVRGFLMEHPEFVLEREEQLLPVSGLQDGFYFARMRKKQEKEKYDKIGHKVVEL